MMDKDELEKKGWLKPKSAALYADCSVTTIYNWMKDEVHPLPSSKKGGRRIKRENIDAYLDSQEQRGWI